MKEALQWKKGELMRNISSLAGLILFVCLSLSWGIAHSSDRQNIPDTIVSIEPPPGFTKMSKGFENKSTLADIKVIEMPIESYDELFADTFSDLDSAKQNSASQNGGIITIIDLKSLDTLAGKVPVSKGTIEVGGMTFKNWLALFKGKKSVIVIHILSPKKEDFDDDEAFKVIQSVQLDEDEALLNEDKETDEEL